MAKRKRRAGGNRCRTCNRPIVLMGHPVSGKWAPFEPNPVDGRNHKGPDAYPAENKTTYRVRELIEELQVRYRCTYAEAETHAYDMPWFVLHRCPNDPPAATQTNTDDEHDPTGATR